MICKNANLFTINTLYINPIKTIYNLIVFIFQTIRQELQSGESRITDLESQIGKLGSQYQTPEGAALSKDVSVLRKKYLTAVGKAGKVEGSLKQAIEGQVDEAALEQTRWLNTAREKVAWCQDLQGKYLLIIKKKKKM